MACDWERAFKLAADLNFLPPVVNSEDAVTVFSTKTAPDDVIGNVLFWLKLKLNRNGGFKDIGALCDCVPCVLWLINSLIKEADY